MGEDPLDAQASVLAPVVIGAGVVHAPVGAGEGGLAFDEGVAELVEDHLGEAVVRIEGGGVADREGAVAVGGGVGVRGADDAQADAARGAQPDLGKGIDVVVGDLARHGAASTTVGTDVR
jgi:hypothetical protein